VGALDQLRGADGGIVQRARSNPRLIVAIAAGVILVLAWIGWAIYVTSENGAGAGLGVVIAWPAMLAALALISLPFIGGYLLVKRLSEDSGSSVTAEAEGSEDEEETQDSAEDEEPAEEEEQDEADEEDDSDEDEEESEDEDDSESEAKAAKS
jgi:hypothetical protein